jgi:hypothetical protein
VAAEPGAHVPGDYQGEPMTVAINRDFAHNARGCRPVIGPVEIDGWKLADAAKVMAMSRQTAHK